MLQTVKDYLKITWADEDAAIQGIIDRGKAYLNGLAGTELDYAVCVSNDEQYAAYLNGLAGTELDYAVCVSNDEQYAADLRAILGELTAEPAEGEEAMTIDEAIAQILAAEGRRDSCTAKPSLAVSLLLDYCRYAYSNALEYFEENFRAQILRLQLLEGVKALADEVAP